MNESAHVPQVVHFTRKPLPDYHSIENLFETLREAMRGDVNLRVEECPLASRGLFARRANLKWAAQHQGEVNHITGDVHYLALGLEPSRTVLTVHDCVALHRGGMIRRAILKRLYFRWPVERARIVTAISAATRRELIEATGCDPDKVRLVPDCVSDVFTFSPAEFNVDRPRVLHVGTLPHKNLARVAEALRGRRCVLHVIGRLTDPQRAMLSGIEVETGRDLTPAAMADAYRRADVVMFPSLFEGFGLPILEGQATGRVVITSDREPMRDVAGGGAVLVDPEDAGAIGEAFGRVVSDSGLRADLIEKGRANAAKYSPARIAGIYLDIYREVAAG